MLVHKIKNVLNSWPVVTYLHILNSVKQSVMSHQRTRAPLTASASPARLTAGGVGDSAKAYGSFFCKLYFFHIFSGSETHFSCTPLDVSAVQSCHPEEDPNHTLPLVSVHCYVFITPSRTSGTYSACRKTIVPTRIVPI